MMFVANNQHPRRPADSLQRIEQTLNCAPRRAQIHPQDLDVLVTPSDLGHESACHAPEVFGPLVSDFSSRGNNDNAVNLTIINQRLRDRTRCYCLASPWGSVNQKVPILPLNEEPV
jgi:hypothetical protein